jgi:hypothetical protein
MKLGGNKVVVKKLESSGASSSLSVDIAGKGNGLVVGGSGQARVDQKEVDQDIHRLNVVYGDHATDSCLRAVGIAPDKPSPIKPPNPSVKTSPVQVLPESGDELPSLMSAFRKGGTQEIAGDGTVEPPGCDLSDGVLTIRVPQLYVGFAGCYIELPDAVDLTAFNNGIFEVELQSPVGRLEIKLESGPAGEGHQEVWLVKDTSPGRKRSYRVRVAPDKMPIMQQARRLVVALAGKPTGKKNVITVRRSPSNAANAAR